MFVPFLDGGIISQFEGYDELEELDWDDYRERYPNIQRLDRILKAEGDDPDRFKLTKQADAVLLFFLFSNAGAAGPVRAPRLRVHPRHRPQNRRVLRPANLARLDAELHRPRGRAGGDRSGELMGAVSGRARERRRRRAGGTTKEGIHMGVMSGTLDLVQRSYAGQQRPQRGAVVRAAADRSSRWAVVLDAVSRHAAAGVAEGWRADGASPTSRAQSQPVRVGVGDEVHELCPGDRWTFDLRRESVVPS